MLVALGLAVVTAAAAVGITVERWQEDQSSLREDVEIAAFRLSETRVLADPSVDLPAGADGYAVLFDAEGNVVGQSQELADDLIGDLLDDVWSFTTTLDEVVIVEFDDREPAMTVAGVRCVDVDVCDTVVVGVSDESFGSFLVRHLGWVFGPALIAGALGLVAARWLVGRSLLPVEEMRTRLDQITASDLERRVPVPGSGDELQRLGESMNATLTRLGAAVSANERFVGDAAHELRSPITGVRAALEIEAAKTSDTLLSESIAELDRASRLVDDLLVLARRQGKPSVLEDVDLDDLARTALGALRTRQPDLEVNATLAPCRLRGNSDDLQRIIMNLLENAARYGGGQLNVSTVQDGDRALLQVDDDGPGIPQDRRDQIFDRFTRLDSSRSRETGGSGLGLAIAKELVEDHGGTVTVSDASIGGASFIVRLPCQREPATSER